MIDDIIVVEHSLVALVSLELSLRKLAVIHIVELVFLDLLLIFLKVLNLAYLLHILLLAYLRFGWSLAQAVIFYPHVRLVEVSRRDIVIEVQELTLDGLLLASI